MKLQDIRSLKTLLHDLGLDTTRCVEKDDLIALWQRYQELCVLPLAELKRECETKLAKSGSCSMAESEDLFTPEACAKFLLSMNAPERASGNTAASISPPNSRNPAADQTSAKPSEPLRGTTNG